MGSNTPGAASSAADFWLPKPSKIEIWRGLRAIFGESGGVLGSLRASWGCFGRALGESWHVQGRLGGVLGLSWGVLGRFWEGFGMSWEPSGNLLAVFLEDFLHFTQFTRIVKNLGKPMVFH